MTAEGFRPYPLPHEIRAILENREVSLKEIAAGPPDRFPMLITAKWCPFTVPARSFWQNAARKTGVELRIVDAESEEGGHIMAGASVAGVPCLLLDPDRSYYGLEISDAEAEFLLASLSAAED